ncbi:MAG TPA: hypothetical protein VKA46_06040 [Gemmataceae bacterium]|nr:hypothetical protein [Gemmataceae bacterium]
MLFSDLPFSVLRKLLLDLGFEEKALPASSVVPVPSIAFRDAESDTFFLFRAYRPQDKVSMADLVTVRKQLDWRGLLGEETFDTALRKASA